MGTLDERAVAPVGRRFDREPYLELYFELSSEVCFGVCRGLGWCGFLCVPLALVRNLLLSFLEEEVCIQGVHLLVLLNVFR